MITAGTLFSGIGAPECAAPGIDWRWAAEIDPFASAVHAARFPGLPNLGNVLEIDWHAVEPVDLVVGGPPCQDYSVAGQRASLSGARGDLTLQYAHILDAIDPAWSVTENVPGWLSTPDNAFGTFLGILVGHDAALVPGRGRRWTDSGVVAGPRRTAAWRSCPTLEDCALPLDATRAQAVAFHQNVCSEVRITEVMGALNTGGGKPGQGYPAIAFDQQNMALGGDVSGTLDQQHHGRARAVQQAMSVRRLTPVECERLQGFPDGWTDVPSRGKPAADGPRYRAVGNSMAVPVIGWVLSRVQQIAAAALEEAA